MSMLMSKGMKNEEDHDDERWSKGLPDHILQSIQERLCVPDYQVFRQVCPNWRAAIHTGIVTKTACLAAHKLPWLLVRRPYDSLHAFSIKDQFSCVRDPNLFPSINIANYCPVPPDLEDEACTGPFVIATATQACLGSIGSWLIVAAHQNCQDDNSTTVVNFFLNPVSRARVMLPSQSTLNKEYSFSTNTTFLFRKIVASSPPGLQEDCVVAALVETGKLAFCRPNDTEWTLIDPDFPKFGDIEIFDGKLFALTQRGNLMRVFDMSPEDANVIRANSRVLSHGLVPFPNFLPHEEWKCPCLAKDSASNELFVVFRMMNMKEGFNVYKSDGKIDDPHGMRWEPVTDLGDRIMFLSDQTAKVIRDRTLGGNCIYFAFTNAPFHRFGVYSLKDSSIKPLQFPEDYSATYTPSDGKGQTIWFTPCLF